MDTLSIIMEIKLRKVKVGTEEPSEDIEIRMGKLGMLAAVNLTHTTILASGYHSRFIEAFPCNWVYDTGVNVH